jgi:hypothetical protein
MYVLYIASHLVKQEKTVLLILFVIAVLFRLLPELIAYPYPIGYDVINYYIPVITNFDDKWSMVSSQFPLYVSLLHLTSVVSGLGPPTVVRLAAILIFGFFSISVYQLSKKILHLDQVYSLFLALFVILQISVLRTSWDLHRDMLSLTSMFFVLCFGTSNKSLSKNVFALVMILCIVSVLADRMIGLLLTTSLIVFAAIQKNRKYMILATVTSIVFITALLQGISEIGSNVHILNGASFVNNVYKPLNLLILFAVTNILLIPTSIIGFLNTRQIILKIPLLLSLFGSLSWLIFPSSSGLLPDRWTFIFSIFLSIFAGYGFVILTIRLTNSLLKYKQVIVITTLIPFIAMGMLFAVTSNERPMSLFAPFHDYVGQFGPLTMQYNSVSIPESKSIVSAIEWINQHTPIGSHIIIDKRWRGWIEDELKDRKFQFYEQEIKSGMQTGQIFLLKLNNSTVPYGENIEIQGIYYNDDFVLYKISFSILK